MGIAIVWTSEEDTALEEALTAFGTRWTEIKRVFGPDGNGKLSRMIKHSRISTRANAIANKRKTLGQDLGTFSVIFDKETTTFNQSDDTSIVHQRGAHVWTDDDNEMLLQGYSQFSENWTAIAKAYPTLYNKHYVYGSSFKNQLWRLQKAGIRSNNLPHVLSKPIQGLEKLFHREFATFHGLMSITCPWCKKQLTETYLLFTGLSCSCGIYMLLLAQELDCFKHVTYIISKLNTSLTDPVIYVGVANQLRTRLLQHETNWVHDFSQYTVRVSMRINEHTAIKLFSPEKNHADTCVRSESFICRVNSSEENGLVKEIDIRQLNHHHPDFVTKLPLLRDHSFVENVGIVFGPIHYMFYDANWCYIEGLDECKCLLPCKTRALRNQHNRLPPYYPIPLKLVRHTCKFYPRPNIDYTLGLPYELTERFFLDVIQRNRSILTDTCADYVKSFSRAIQSGFIQFGSYPDLFHNQLLHIYGYLGLSTLLLHIKTFLGQLSTSERTLLYGNRFHQVYQLYSLFLGYHRHVENHSRSLKRELEPPKPVIPYQELLQLIPVAQVKVIHQHVEHGKLQQFLAFYLHVKHCMARSDFSQVKTMSYDTAVDDYIDLDRRIIIVREPHVDDHFEFHLDDNDIQLLQVLIQHNQKRGWIYLFSNTKGQHYPISPYGVLLRNFTKIVDTEISLPMIRKSVHSHLLAQYLSTTSHKYTIYLS
jgi:hypothetical protein